jgi:peptidoglycan/xylan/chitin deacetylase (PgdA/CDA1 family)
MMKKINRNTFRRPLARLPYAVQKGLVPRQLIALFYHLVSEKPLPHVAHLYPYRPLHLFEQDLVYIKENYQPVSYPQLVERKTTGSPTNRTTGSPTNRTAGSPKKSTALHISFDDGFAECFTLARPLLIKYDIPCTFFLTTDFLDNARMYYRNTVSLCIDKVLAENQVDSIKKINQEFGLALSGNEEFVRWIKSLTDEVLVEKVCACLGIEPRAYLADQQPYLTTAQVQALAAEGFTIGAHTCRHQKLARLSWEEIEHEIVESCQIVAEISGQDSVPFSFPNSGEGVDRQFLADLRRRNPVIGLVFDTKGLRPERDHILNRIWVESPKLNPGGCHSLPSVLRQAYREYFLAP